MQKLKDEMSNDLNQDETNFNKDNTDSWLKLFFPIWKQNISSIFESFSFVKSEKNQDRMDWLDWIKAIAILMVIFGHLSMSENLPYAAYTSHVKLPLFFAASGFVYRIKNGTWDFIKKRVYSLLLPYVCISYLYKIIASLPEIINGTVDLMKILRDTTRLILVGQIMWFVPVLFVIEIMMLILNHILKLKDLWIFLLSVTMLAFGSFSKKGIHYWMSLDTLFVSFPCFVLGYFLRKKHFNEIDYDKNKMGIACTVFYILFPSILASVPNGNWHYMNINDKIYTNYPINILLIFSGVVAFFYIMPQIKHGCTIITALGRNTLFYYGYHVTAFNLFLRIL